MDFTNELRLLGLIAINAIVLSAAWFFVGRVVGRERSGRVMDTLLIWYAVQYVAVCGSGLLHVLGVTSMYTIAALLSIAMVGIACRQSIPKSLERETSSQIDRGIVTCAALFAFGFVSAFAWHQRYQPILATDPLVYHMPTAIHWLQQRTLAMYDVWFWMPANTYSPLAGTAFTVWLFGSLGNDVLARGVQLPTLAILFVAIFKICRSLGSSPTLAALIAIAGILSRPFLSQVLTPKDDLFVCAFFLATIASLTPNNLSDRTGPWRIGILIGLLLATKYTVLLTLPVLILAIDAPWRAGWRWRQWLIAIATASCIAMPWYARNWIITGNPLYPVDLTVADIHIFVGMFTPSRSDTLKSIAGIWGMLSDTYHSMPVTVLVPLLGMALAAIVLSIKSLRDDPLLRVVLLGPFLGLTLFVLLSPHAEVRYMFPLFLLLFVGAAAFNVQLRSPRWLTTTIGTAIVVVSILTTLRFSNVMAAVGFASVGAVVMFVGIAYLVAGRLMPQQHLAIVTSGSVAFVGLLWMYIAWRSYVTDYRDSTADFWRGVFNDTADGWAFVRDQLPPDATLAIANTYNVYPLYGFSATRPICYVPVRLGVHALHDLPRLSVGIKADDVIRTISEVTNAEADRDTWLTNLRASGAAFLYVAKTEATNDAPELRFATADSGKFEKVFDNPAVAIFRIRWPARAQ